MVLSFAILAAWSAAAWADPPMTTLRVEVKTLQDRPVERASVIVRFDEGRSMVKLGKKIVKSWQMRTNQDGVAKIPPLPQGKIMVQVIAKGYQTYGHLYEVDEAERTIEIKLNPPQPQHTEHK